LAVDQKVLREERSAYRLFGIEHLYAAYQILRSEVVLSGRQMGSK